MEFSSFYNMKRKTTEVTPDFIEHFDVAVAGLGTAGSVAAARCRELGLKTLGVEYFNSFGGTSTVGQVNGFYFGTVGGKGKKIEEKCEEYNKTITSLNTQAITLIADEELEGVTILDGAVVCGVFHKGGKALGIRCLKNRRFFDYSCDFVIDSTADCFVAEMLGCRTEKGRKSDGLMQPYTMISVIENEDKKASVKNVDFGRVDQKNYTELSKAYIFSRGFENTENTIAQAQLIGVREGPRIISEETVKLCDVFNNKFTEKPVFYAYADLDKHGEDVAFDGEEFLDWNVGANMGAVNISVPVPFGVLIPKGYENILVACRGLGVDRNMSSLIRMIRDMYKVGEVAADGVFLAKCEKCSLKDIPYEKLKKMLAETKCLDESQNFGYRTDKVSINGVNVPPEKVEFITDVNKLNEVLKTDRPSVAIWSAKLMGEKSFEILEKNLSSENENLRKHSAFALAINNNKKSLEELKKIVAERDGFILQDQRKHNRMRGWIAIYFLGKLKDRSCVPLLTEILTDGNVYKSFEYYVVRDKAKRKPEKNFEFTYFQFVSLSINSLANIGDEYPETRTEISTAFKKTFHKNFEKEFTDLPELSSKFTMVRNMKLFSEKKMKEWGIAP